MSGGGEKVLLTGWGRSAASAARVVSPTSTAEVEKIVSELSDGESGLAVPRGLGRSYGDAAQCAGATVIDCRQLVGTIEIDEAGRLRAPAGLSIEDLLAHSVGQGWFVPVTPGTRFVTLGGAVASDIHGKNHHVDGSFSAHVSEIELVTPSGTLRCGPEDEVDAFWATCGGMGLTGVVTEVDLQLIPIESAFLKVDTERAPDIEACMAILSDHPERYRYSVAWVDGTASGSNFGRSVITRADHARPDELPGRLAADPLAYGPRSLAAVPLAPPVTPLGSVTIGVLNELWYQKAPRRPRQSFQSIPSFFHPLDAVSSWNLLYGRHGFTQYQFAVPFGAEEVVRQVLEKLGRAGQPPFLVVLKTFGPEAKGHLSFPLEGWTLALDLPLGRLGLGELLDRLDELVLEAGGRVYLSKDSRLAPEALAQMYPRLGQWRAVADRLDPAGVFSSDLGRRLGLRPLERAGQR